MFPFRDHNPTGKTPFVTIALIAINVLVYLVGLFTLNSDRELWQFYQSYAMIPAEITAGEDYSTLITSMFLHGGFMHILGNMLFLWIFGDNMEDRLGHIGFLLFYLLSGLAASFLQIWSDPMSTIPNVGASGAIAGVMGGYMLYYPRARVDSLLFFVIFFTIISLPAWGVLIYWFVIQLASSLLDQSGAGGVAYWAHVGGFVAGALMTLPFWLKDGGSALWQRTHGRPPHPATQYSRSRIPTVKR